MDNLNESFETTFEIAEGSLQLGKDRPRPLDRNNVVEREAGHAGFRATVHRVQYGTCHGQRACLVTFNYAFRWPASQSRRFRSARITVYFGSEVGTKDNSDYNSDGDDDDDASDKNEPSIVYLVPALVYGEPKVRREETMWNWKLPISVQPPGGGPSGGMTIEREVKAAIDREMRMRVCGVKKSSNYSDIDDIAEWTITENSAQLDGIPPYFQAAVVLRWPANSDRVMASVVVEPEFDFSFSNMWYSYRLHQRRRDPICFDGKTSKGDPIDTGKDFSDTSFQWSAAISVPTEYGVWITAPFSPYHY
ncbi:uncharacterized protein B0I36DRAFT_351617 [Microdochium trichocladiopsis]|uniref:Uncharacterized protein n=1 Tax=Microdochium trichocladiopsis TaxID=1682393 RepID=A0A9P9BLL4_9PEZI|nr:uncharacterized protein B0I36DRAFT_351617 [Microdochium trichocladiopsis]KAH7028207.1 hypothetical protein B0I36DRAFT_351617 [Microdochium trichocladiopsis]